MSSKNSTGQIWTHNHFCKALTTKLLAWSLTYKIVRSVPLEKTAPHWPWICVKFIQIRQQTQQKFLQIYGNRCNQLNAKFEQGEGKKNAPRNFFQSFTEGSIYAVDSNSVCLIGRLHLCCFFLLYFLLSAIHKRRQWLAWSIKEIEKTGNLATGIAWNELKLCMTCYCCCAELNM